MASRVSTPSWRQAWLSSRPWALVYHHEPDKLPLVGRLLGCFEDIVDAVGVVLDVDETGPFVEAACGTAAVYGEPEWPAVTT